MPTSRFPISYRPPGDLSDGTKGAAPMDVKPNACERAGHGGMSDMNEVELEESLRQVRRLASHLQEAREHERRSIAREIQDELGHQLTALKLDLVSLERELQSTGSSLAGRAVSMKALFDQVIASVRRISSELRPGLLDDFGLAAAIEWQAEAFEEKTGIAVELDLHDEGEALLPAVEIAAFRILQEALHNVARHARADRVVIALRGTGRELRLEVTDDGGGFDLARASHGITGMRERAIALGGSFELETRPGLGTKVAVALPMGEARRELLPASAWLTPHDERKTILLVEDDPDLQRGLAIRLKASGFRVVSASGIDALTRAARETPDLAILDLKRLGNRGLDPLGRSATDRPATPVPIILLTAADPALAERHALELGAAAFFQKPADTKEILACVAWLLAGAESEALLAAS